MNSTARECHPTKGKVTKMTRYYALSMLLLIGCAETHTAPIDAGPPTAPDLGGCLGLSATQSDAGPVAHVYPYPDGTACEGGVCVAGECVP